MRRVDGQLLPSESLIPGSPLLTQYVDKYHVVATFLLDPVHLVRSKNRPRAGHQRMGSLSVLKPDV